MSIQFRRVPPDVLDLSTGHRFSFADGAPRLVTPPAQDEAPNPFHAEIQALIDSGEANQDEIAAAIDQHPDITDKESLKSFAKSYKPQPAT